ncbi:MAG: prenyltransferase [Acidimicrobiales bacterium]
MPQPDLPGVMSGAEVERTAAHIAEWQLPTGMIPWFPGGHADAWNHVEAAMALDVADMGSESVAAYQWLADMQRPDGAWHQYYLDGSVEQDKLDANCVAYVATGVWHHYLITKDAGFLESMWRVVEAAIEFVLDLQTPRGEILWARHADNTPWSFALLTGSSSMTHSIRCAVAIAEELGHERPGWELGAARLAHVIRTQPEAFAPKDRWAMDWYYPVLTGVLTGKAAKERLAGRFEEFVMEGHGVRCVSDRPWVTTAETCECALAHLVAGEEAQAIELFSSVAALRHHDGSYFTGLVVPDGVSFPDVERSTYSAAAVVLTADALANGSAASTLFLDHSSLPALIDIEATHDPSKSTQDEHSFD